MAVLLTMLFNGLAYGMLLFIMSVGLSVTMGMMRFVNLAHASLCMLGGDVAGSAMDTLGLPFVASLPLAQVLLTIGLVFMSVASVAYFWGASFKAVKVPPWLTGQVPVLGLVLERYRIFLVLVGAVLTLLLVFGLERTRFGAMVRACVDNRRAAAGCGLNTQAVFAVAFAVGGGLAGLGGALAANLLGLDPNFPLRYLVVVLIVVSVGGMGTIVGTLLAAVLFGVADLMGKYYLPAAGGSVIYLVTVAVMLWRPQGLLGRKL